MNTIPANDDNETLTFIAWSPTLPGAALPASQLSNSSISTAGQRALATFNLVPPQRSDTPALSEFENLYYLISALQLVSTTPDSDSLRQQARREIAALHIRPKLVDGAVEQRKTIRIDYFFLPQDERIVLSNK